MILDAFLLETLFRNKIKKHCPFLKSITVENIESGGVCMEASYQMSLIVQDIVQDFKAGNKHGSL